MLCTRTTHVRCAHTTLISLVAEEAAADDAVGQHANALCFAVRLHSHAWAAVKQAVLNLEGVTSIV